MKKRSQDSNMSIFEPTIKELSYYKFNLNVFKIIRNYLKFVDIQQYGIYDLDDLD